MRHCLLFVAMIVLVAFLPAQERRATVRLDDGRQISGRIVDMELERLRIEIDGEIVTLSAKDIKSCRIEAAGEQAEDPAAPRPLVESTSAASGPVQQLVPEPDAEPFDVRGQTLFDRRIASLDRVFPWLCPTSRQQWISLGLLLFSLLSLMIHGSAVLAGAESATFGRSLLLSLGYLVLAGAQVALVPLNDFTLFSMLIGNAAVALFLVRASFSMTRVHAFVALALQAGFGVVGFGVLELVDSLLGSVGVA